MMEVGTRFGKLVVESLSVGASRTGKRKRTAICVCDCGAVKEVGRAHLTKGTTRSCGCIRAERAAGMNVRHGHARKDGCSPTYRSWNSMLTRCAPGYHHAEDYFERGITVCERWKSFENFLADMGERPAGTSIERQRNHEGYMPGNCRWATAKEQRANQRPHPGHLINAPLEDLIAAIALKIDAPLTIQPKTEG